MKKEQTKKRKGLSLADYFTLLRFVGAFCLLFVEPLVVQFYLIYSACGLSDILDGYIARVTGSTSEIGARLDSAGDILFYGVMLIRVFPFLWDILPRFIWGCVAVIILIRLLSYMIAAFKYRCFASLHTYLNKITGFAMFMVPYMLKTDIDVIYCFFVATIAFLSSTEEFIIHLLRPSYNPEVNSIFKIGKKV